MYTARPLIASGNRAGANAAFVSPRLPAPRNSGWLAVQDEDDVAERTCCWGLCVDTSVRELPFPHNRILTVRYSRQEGEHRRFYWETVVFVPVLDQPPESNRYYVVAATGKRKGLVFTCSTEDDMTPCCFCKCINDRKPTEFDPNNIYQQMEILPHNGRFTAKAVAPDAFPPFIFRQKYWHVSYKKSKDYDLQEALGINEKQRACLPEPEFIAVDGPSIGKWYCPYFFVKEDGMLLKEQTRRAMFYEITLEHRWELLKDHSKFLEDEKVHVKERIPSIAIAFGDGMKAVQEYLPGDEDFVWFKSAKDRQMAGSLGLMRAVWERMKWEQYNGGWVDEDAEVDRVEQYGGSQGWKRLGLFVFAERFVMKRMDGSIVATFDFMQASKVKVLWV